MNRIVIAVAAAALFACGGKEVKFNLKSPPQWLKNLDDALQAKQMRRDELTSGNCLGREFIGQCEMSVRSSRSLTRKAKFRLLKPGDVRITYTPGGDANPVTVTLRGDDPATVPVRKSGGTLKFVCRTFRCTLDLL